MIRDQYEVELENTYNVYEKGFAIGMTERSNASNRFKVIILSGLRFWFVLVGKVGLSHQASSTRQLEELYKPYM